VAAITWWKDAGSMRLFILLIFFLLLMTGCSLICPQQKQALLQDQIEFSRAFDHFQSTGNINELLKFKGTYSDTLWAERAGTVIQYSQKLHQQKQQVKALQSSEKILHADVERLKKENQQFAEKLEQLKSLLIQSEMQPQ